MALELIHVRGELGCSESWQDWSLKQIRPEQIRPSNPQNTTCFVRKSLWAGMMGLMALGPQ